MCVAGHPYSSFDFFGGVMPSARCGGYGYTTGMVVIPACLVGGRTEEVFGGMPHLGR